jgi:dTDP-4-amino-4,6-dideoxygalactose transaminase
MIIFDGKSMEQREFTVDDILKQLNEKRDLNDNHNRLLYKYNLVTADRDQLEQDLTESEARTARAYELASMQKMRADRLERIITGMNNSLTELINDNESTLLNDTE